MDGMTINHILQDAVMSEQKKKLVAYHEAGHAILGALMCLDLVRSHRLRMMGILWQR
jgi:ATP-dependent Zn protease